MKKTTTYWLELVYGHWLHCLTHTLTQFHMQIILSLLRMKASYSVMLKLYSWRFYKSTQNEYVQCWQETSGIFLPFTSAPQRRTEGARFPEPIHTCHQQEILACLWDHNVLHMQCLLPHCHSPKHWNVAITRNIILTHVHWLYCKSTK